MKSSSEIEVTPNLPSNSAIDDFSVSRFSDQYPILLKSGVLSPITSPKGFKFLIS